jgi:hypothetical protein
MAGVTGIIKNDMGTMSEYLDRDQGSAFWSWAIGRESSRPSKPDMVLMVHSIKYDVSTEITGHGITFQGSGGDTSCQGKLETEK